MDFIDLMVDTSEEYLTGFFYKRRPKNAEDGRISFLYKQLDPNSRVFDTVLGNVRADRATYAIKSNDNCGFNVGGFVITQNGLIWEIVEVIRNEEVKGSNDALRWFKRAVNTECSVRMIQVDDLFDIEDSYNTMCKVNVKTNNVDLTSIVVTETLLQTTIPYNQTASNEFSFEVEKNTAVSVVVQYGKGVSKKIQIPSYRTVESELLLEYSF